MKTETGQAFYGQYIGVLVFSSTAPRIPGDAGHAGSFSYPVRYEIVEGGFMDLLDHNDEIKDRILHACINLKRLGIRGIIGDCGMMSLYQDCLGAEIGIPFIGSSLCQIPMIWQMAGREGSIGILTGHSGLLSEKHLRASGWNEEIKLSVQGMQDEPHFHEIVIRGGKNLNMERMRRDVLHAAEILREKTLDLRAIVIECSNLSTYARCLSDQFDLPVFDTMSAANLLSYAVHPPIYIGDFYKTP